MGQIGRFVRFWFGLQALSHIGIVPTTVMIVLAVRRGAEFNGYTAEDFPGGVTLWGAVSLVLSVVPAIAWWTLKKGRPAGRAWAIAGSIASLLFPLHRLRPPAFDKVDFLVGILGLIAFSRPQTASAVADSEQPKPVRLQGDGTNKSAEVLAGVTGFAGLWLAYFGWSRWGLDHGAYRAGLVTEVILLQLAVLIVVICHESGHVIAGWAAGMQLRRFHIGPFLWEVRSGSWKFKFDLARSLGGSVGMVSPKFSDMRGAALMTLGGPAGSLLTAALAGIAALNVPRQTSFPLWSVFAMISSIALVDFVVNLIPQRPEAHYSDGAQCYQLMTEGPWATVHLAFAMATSSLVSSTRPRDWDLDLLHRAAGVLTAGERAIMVRIFMCMHHLETGRIPEATRCLEEAESLFDPSNVKELPACYLDLAFFNAVCKRDVTRAEHWWNRREALGQPNRDVEYWAALASIRWLRGDHDGATEALAHGGAVGRNLPSAGAYEFDRWRIEYVREAMSSTPMTVEQAQ